MPDTPIVRGATESVRPLLTETMWEHSVRTFLIGQAWATKKRIMYDDETLCLAALFHDVGLCERYRIPRAPFTEGSMRAARDFVGAGSRAEAVATAIGYHMQPWPRWSKGAECGLLQIGSWMDVVGLRRWSLDTSEIRAAHPRRGLGREFTCSLLRSFSSLRAVVRLVAPKI